MQTSKGKRAHMRSLEAYVLHHRRRVWWGMALVITSVLVSIGAPFITRYAVDALVDGHLTTGALAAYAAGYFAAVVLAAALSLRMRLVLLGLGHEIECTIRRDAFQRLTHLDAYFYGQERTGDLMTKLTSDLTSVQELLGQGVLQVTRTGTGFLLAFGVMFAIQPKLAAVMFLLLPAISIVFFYLLRLLRERYEISQAQFSRLADFAQENFAGIRTLRGYGIEARQRKRFEALNTDYIEMKMALNRVERPLWPSMILMFGLGIAIILQVGGRLVVSGELTVGQFVQFTQYLFILQWPMLALGWTLNLWQRGMASWERIQTILSAHPRIQDSPSADPAPSKAPRSASHTAAIAFEGVTLELGGQKVLDDIHLLIPPGTTLGITGPTGGGKTLLAALIARWMDPTAGRVRLNERDVREWPLTELRLRVSMAPQEAFLFSDTLANNIALGLEEVDAEKICAAADIASLTSDVELFPDRFETRLGERGVTLSGGQRQRTAISRAIAADPDVLILDDVFSAIDTHTESIIQAKLRDIIRDRTTLIISHRVSSLRHADHIIVLENGRITQQGTHRALVEQPGYYRELDEWQRLEAALEHGT